MKLISTRACVVVLFVLLGATGVQAQCPTLSVLDASCTLGDDCALTVTLDPSAIQVASVAATAISDKAIACSADCAPAAAASNASCTINDDICRFVVADLETPVTAFEAGPVASISFVCLEEGVHTVSLVDASLGTQDGNVVFPCTGMAVVSCLPAVCFAAADPAATFTGNMTADFSFTGGADNDPLLDNLTAPLVFASSTTNAMSGGSGDEVAYPVDLPASGVWYLWGRFYYPGAPGSNDANSFFVRLDGSTTLKKFGNNKSFFQTWHWDGDGNLEGGPPAPLALGTLAAGPHTLTVEKREVVPVPPRLDVICFTQSTTPPSDGLACAALGGCP